MKEMTVSEAMSLVRRQPEPAISLYLGTNLPERDGATRIKSNLQRLYRTAEALVARTHDARMRERLLQPLKKALSALRLTRSRGGIAIYHSAKFTGIVRLPTRVVDLAVAADSFHLKPLLRCAQLRRSYYLLALHKRHAELLMVTADGTRLVETFSLRSSPPPSEVSADASQRLFKEGYRIRRQKDLQASMADLNRQLQTSLHGERLPLVLAGAHHKIEAFRAICSYGHILERSVAGVIDECDHKALVVLSEQVMEQYFAAIDSMAVVAFRRAKAAGLASTDLRQIAAAVARGQVQSLLVAEDRQVWGHLDRNTGCVQVLEQQTDARSDDLLDDIGELTILKGGHVTVLPSLEMPVNSPIAAVLRWSDHAHPLVAGEAWSLSESRRSGEADDIRPSSSSRPPFDELTA